jgi:Phytanoyl-CoA dioxygenase (PhyH)
MIATEAINGIEGALRQSGVNATTLAAREKESLDRQGFVVFPSIVDDEWLEAIRATFNTSLAQGKRHGAHVHLPCLDPVFDGIYSQPRVLAAVHHVLRRAFRTFPPVGRDPLPGHGLQALHPDWGRAKSEPFNVVTVLWLVDDFTEYNGATRLIPGSHLIPRPVPKALLNPERRHPDQKIIIAEAGSVLVFNGALLHGGTRNGSNRTRRALQCQFRARDVIIPEEQPPAIPERFTGAARYFLGAGATGID